MRRFQPDPSRYENLQVVGEGLNASIYRATRVDSRGHSKQTVALKFLKDGTAVSYLRREFATLSKVRSPNCARVLAWETHGDRCALVLEWIDGPNLFELASQRSLSDDLIDEITAQVYQGLMDLRAEGLHHGDLHPRNVMIDSNGVVKLVDFATPAQGAREIQGVPAFLSPARWKGEPTSFESDIHALSVLKLGLRDGFSQLPNTVEAAMSFSERIVSEQMFPKSRSEARESLKSLISDYILEKTAGRTQVIEIASRREPKFSYAFMRLTGAIIFGLLAISTVGAPVRAEAPLLTGSMRAKVQIRSHKWIEVSLNGKKAGYAPVEIPNLLPGTHRLAWKSASGRGEIVLKLEPGETMRLSEARLEQGRFFKLQFPHESF